MLNFFQAIGFNTIYDCLTHILRSTVVLSASIFILSSKHDMKIGRPFFFKIYVVCFQKYQLIIFLEELFFVLAFTDGELITMFFRLYNELPIELTTRVLQNIVQLSSLRRTLFSNPERQTYLTHIVKGVKGIMEQPDKLRQQVCRGMLHILTVLMANYNVIHQQLIL